MSGRPLPQRAFSLPRATAAAPPGTRLAARVAVLHAVLWLLGVAGISPRLGALSPVAPVAVTVVFNGVQAYLYWQLARWLPAVLGYRGADRWLRLACGIALVDLVVRGFSILSGAGGFPVRVIHLLGVFGVMVSYAHVQYFALGTVLIALGYSLLRIPAPPAPLRRYGWASVAMGMAYAAFLGHLVALPGIAADLLLARLLWPGRRPAALRRRPAFTIAPQE